MHRLVLFYLTEAKPEKHYNQVKRRYF